MDSASDNDNCQCDGDTSLQDGMVDTNPEKDFYVSIDIVTPSFVDVTKKVDVGK